ncbi:MAG: SIR2 family protein, partial [bacterium]|nr:SIR2 family protein [bacterium]
MPLGYTGSMETIDTRDMPGLDLGDETNRENIKELEIAAGKGKIVPFIGAGFSMPACPGWGTFLDGLCDGLNKQELMRETDVRDFATLKEKAGGPDFEAMANLLMNCAGKQVREKEIKKVFDVEPGTGMREKFNLLHGAFPYLKITTNFDQLIEKTAPSSPHLSMARGNQPGELQRWATMDKPPVVLKIHGCVTDVPRIVLTSDKYQEMYGHVSRFKPDTPLPKFLVRIFTNSSLLFLGCSLVNDRVIEILESLENSRPHYAVM